MTYKVGITAYNYEGKYSDEAVQTGNIPLYDRCGEPAPPRPTAAALALWNRISGIPDDGIDFWLEQLRLLVAGNLPIGRDLLICNPECSKQPTCSNGWFCVPAWASS